MKTRILSALLFMTLLIPCNASAMTTDELSDAFSKYSKPLEKLYGNNDIKKLIGECKKLLKKNEDPKAQFIGWTYLAHAYAKQGDKEKTLEAVEKFSAFDDENAMAPVISTVPLLRIGEDQNNVLNTCLKAAQNHEGEFREEMEQLCKDTVANFNKVSASKLWNAFDENEIAAEDAYKGKLVAVSGVVSNISTSVTGNPEITMNVDPYGMKTISFEFSREDRPKLARLKKGKKITIAGRCQGFVMGMSVCFTSCWILD